jgi:hypothetical protein
VDEALLHAVALFNDARYAEFQTALEGFASSTRAASERRFYTLLDKLAEGLLRLSDGDRRSTRSGWSRTPSARSTRSVRASAGSTWMRSARTCSSW